MDKPNRMTVDLSPYPDLVVIYLGMRVNAAPRGVRTLPSYWPKIKASAQQLQTGYCCTKTCSIPCFLRTWECGSTGATSTRSSAGHMICRTRHGGGPTSGTGEAPASARDVLP